MNRVKIKQILDTDQNPGEVLIKGWIRTKRDSKDFSFLEINDGSSLKNIQVIAQNNLDNYEDVTKLTTGSAVSVKGTVVESPGKGQKWEINASYLEVVSIAPETYPLQKKRHTDEFLRTIAHLRPRTNKYGSVFRIRSELAFAVHKFYNEKGFRYVHTPIITGSDCEGAGELFKVTTLDGNDVEKGKFNYEKDFFGKETNLTVSGQLSAEMFALSLGDVYTFGPTFRAENSNTSRHVAEFWMIEPEMAFCDLEENMNHAEEFLKYVTQHICDNCADDINLFTQFVDKSLKGVIDSILNSKFKRLPYDEAIEILKKADQKFEYEVEYGLDLQSEHERYITEKHFKIPVFIYNYPKTIKPFYMRMNDDNKTVAAMDLLVPRIGELIGGSQREERLDILLDRLKEMNLPEEDYWWYIDSRKYGTVPHSGFGLGFERLIMLLTGVTNIRDVIPFPRTPSSIDF